MGRIAALVIGAFVVGYLVGASGSKTEERAERIAAPTVEPAAAPAPSADPELSRALATLPVPEVPRGTATITGTIKTADGTPVPGVTITGSQQGQYLLTKQPDDSLESHVRMAVERYHVNRLLKSETQTQADGSYVLEGLTEGETYRISARHDDYRFQPAPGQPPSWQIPAGASHDWIASRTYNVTVNVRLAGGGEPELASISSEQGSSTHATQWRPVNRVLKLSEGRHKIEVTVKDEIHGRARAEVTVGPENPTATLDLVLPSPPGIRGSVKAIGGLDRLTARILADVPDAEKRLLDGGQRARVKRGRYVFRDLAPGTYLLGITYDDRHLLATRRVVVGNAMGTADFVIDTFPRSAFAVVRTFDPRGKPVRDITFTTKRVRDHSSNSYGGVRGIVQKDGSWLVPHQHGTGGKVYIRADSSTYGRSPEIEYDPSTEKDIVIRFVDPAFVEITFANYSRSALVGRIGVSLPGSDTKRPDEKGRVTLGPVAPGSYKLGVTIYFGDHRSVAAPPVPLELATGKQSQTIPVPAVYRLTVTVPADVDRVTLRRGYASLSETAAGGRVMFADLPAGKYTLRATNAKRIEFELTSDRTIAMESK